MNLRTGDGANHPATAHLAPALEFAFRATLTFGAPIDQGEGEGRRRRIVPIAGGIVEGPRFTGKVLPGGADWQLVRVSDGTTQIYARYIWRHDDGTVVNVINRGVRRGPAEVMARLAAGELVDPSSYYLRTTPEFEAPPGPHGWLAENAFVAVGKRQPESVDFDIYRVS